MSDVSVPVVKREIVRAEIPVEVSPEIVIIESESDSDEVLAAPIEADVEILNEDSSEVMAVNTLITREVRQAEDMVAIHTQEQGLYRAQERQYREFEGSSLENLRGCLSKVVRADTELRAELVKTQDLARKSMTDVLAKLKLKCDSLGEGFPRADMNAAIEELKGMIHRVKILPERLAGAIRSANRLQAVKTAHLDVAQSRIRELTDAAQNRRKLDIEIETAAENCERERARVADISNLRDRCGEMVAKLEAKLNEERVRHERFERDIRESGPSTATEPPRLSKSAKRRRAMDSVKRAELRAKQRKTALRNPTKIFPYVGRAKETTVSRQRVTKRLDEYRIRRAENIMTLGRYITVGRRLIFRNHSDLPRNANQKPKERCMLTRIARFWLCIARWKYLQSLKIGEGVKGANRSTRIEDLARDLRVPVDLVRLYKDANPSDYDYYPPASYDLRVVECEGNHEFPEKWDGVRDLEDHLGITDEDEIESEAEGDQNDENYEVFSDSD